MNTQRKINIFQVEVFWFVMPY